MSNRCSTTFLVIDIKSTKNTTRLNFILLNLNIFPDNDANDVLVSSSQPCYLLLLNLTFAILQSYNTEAAKLMTNQWTIK